MADVNHIFTPSNFVEASKNRILAVFSKSTNIQNIIDIESERWKAVDEAAVGLALGRIIDNATGVTLDELGDRLGVQRYDTGDEEYRTAIKIRAFSRNNAATRPDIVNILASFTGSPEEAIDIYQGSQKRLELTFLDGCFDKNIGSDEVIRLLPLVTNYTIFVKFRGSLLGFSAVDSLGNETNPGEFGTLSANFEPVSTEGSMSSIVNTYSTGVL